MDMAVDSILSIAVHGPIETEEELLVPIGTGNSAQAAVKKEVNRYFRTKLKKSRKRIS